MKKATCVAAALLIVIGSVLFQQPTALADDAIPALASIPSSFPSDQREQFDQRRQALQTQLAAFQSVADAFNAKKAEDQPDSEYNALQAQRADYIAAASAFNRDLAAVQAAAASAPVTPVFSPGCANEKAQLDKDRAVIAGNQDQLRNNQMEIDESTANGRTAMADGAKAVLVFLAGSYAADLKGADEKVSTLEEKVNLYASRTANTAKSAKNRLAYAAKLKTAMNELKPLQADLMGKTASASVVDFLDGWDVAKGTWNNAFRVAAKHDQAMQAVLKDPGFKAAFTGDDIDQPAQDVISALTDVALENAGTLESRLEKYETLTGPAVRIGAFVRDGLYNGMLLYESSDAVGQRSDLAGNLAKAANALQGRYKKNVDTLLACRAQGH